MDDKLQAVAIAIANVENKLKGRPLEKTLVGNAKHYFVATPLLLAQAAIMAIKEYEESHKPKLVHIRKASPNIMATATYIARCPKCQGEVPVTITEFPYRQPRETLSCNGGNCYVASTCPSGVRKDSNMCKEHRGVL